MRLVGLLIAGGALILGGTCPAGAATRTAAPASSSTSTSTSASTTTTITVGTAPASAGSTSGQGTSNGRDFWDWLALWATLAATATAIVAFMYWALDRRRRPEALLAWQVLDHERRPQEIWGPEDVKTLGWQGELFLRVAVRNVGDALAESVRTNFVVPDCFTIRRVYGQPEEALTSVDETAGREENDNQVVYMVGGPAAIASDDWFIQDYVVQVKQGTNPGRVRLLLKVSCPRFNASGNRRLRARALDPERTEVPSKAGEPWPPEGESRTFRRIRALPLGRLRCEPGGRSDVRDIDIQAPSTV